MFRLSEWIQAQNIVDKKSFAFKLFPYGHADLGVVGYVLNLTSAKTAKEMALALQARDERAMELLRKDVLVLHESDEAQADGRHSVRLSHCALIPLRDLGRVVSLELQKQSFFAAAACESCKFCGESSAQYRCARCFATRYCSALCQRIHWGFHKYDCRAQKVFALAYTQSSKAKFPHLRAAALDAFVQRRLTDPEGVVEAQQDAAFLRALLLEMSSRLGHDENDYVGNQSCKFASDCFDDDSLLPVP